jgi:hypothetical protein
MRSWCPWSGKEAGAIWEISMLRASLLLGLAGCAFARKRQSLDADWRFTLTNTSEPSGKCDLAECLPDTDDSAWRLLALPHDFVVEGTFSQSADVMHGFLPYGEGGGLGLFCFAGLDTFDVPVLTYKCSLRRSGLSLLLVCAFE